MTDELKTTLDKIFTSIKKQNAGQYANEQAFLDELKPEISKAKEGLEVPPKEQTSIDPPVA